MILSKIGRVGEWGPHNPLKWRRSNLLMVVEAWFQWMFLINRLGKQCTKA
jgi:hypothetical protein